MRELSTFIQLFDNNSQNMKEVKQVDHRSPLVIEIRFKIMRIHTENIKFNG